VTEIAAKNDTIRELEKRLDESARMTIERIKLLISLNWKPEKQVPEKGKFTVKINSTDFHYFQTMEEATNFFCCNCNKYESIQLYADGDLKITT